jgi:hypothetical protein
MILGLNTRILQFLELTSKGIHVRTNNVYTPSFEAMESFFKKLNQDAVMGVSDVPGISADKTSFEKKVHALLFDPNYSTLNEAIRLLRANAILAFAGIPLEEVVQNVLKLDNGLDKDIAEERSSAVKLVLEQVKGKIRG